MPALWDQFSLELETQVVSSCFELSKAVRSLKFAPISIFFGLCVYQKTKLTISQCSSRELLYLVQEFETDGTNLCTNPLSILVPWQTNSD